MDGWVDKQPPQDDIQAELNSRKEFKKTKTMTAITVLSMLLCVVAMVAFFVTSRTIKAPQVFLVLENGQAIPFTSLPLPNQSIITLQTWGGEVIKRVYTFDFVRMNEQVAEAEELFTEEGWVVFKKAFDTSDLKKEIEKKQATISSMPMGDPIVDGPIYLGKDNVIWKIAVPVAITFSGNFETIVKRKLIKMTVVRVPTTKNTKGLGVAQFLQEEYVESAPQATQQKPGKK